MCMKINSVTFANQYVTDNKKNQVSFKTYNPERASMIQRRLAAKGVSAHLDGNDFVAECVEKVTDVFKKLFGDSALPKEVGFKPLREGAYGRYWDVDYSSIFSRKWNYRYSSPQSYIDYFTQQVWNGDLDEAKRVGDKVEQYLTELDAEPVPDVIANVVGVAHSLGVPLFNDIADGVSNFFEKLTDKLDRRNKIGID